LNLFGNADGGGVKPRRRGSNRRWQRKGKGGGNNARAQKGVHEIRAFRKKKRGLQLRLGLKYEGRAGLCQARGGKTNLGRPPNYIQERSLANPKISKKLEGEGKVDFNSRDGGKENKNPEPRIQKYVGNGG